MWKGSTRFDEIVSNRWQMLIRGSPIFKVVQKLKHLKGNLKQHNKDDYSRIHIRECETTVVLKNCQEALHQRPNDLELKRRELQAVEDYRSIHNSYMGFVDHKAKDVCIREGNLNFKFFHGAIKRR